MLSRPTVRIVSGLLVAGATAVVLAGCATASTDASDATPTPTPTAAAWSYEGAGGPDNWGAIAEACAADADARQSPIDIDTNTLVEGSGLSAAVLHYKPTRFLLENTGHTVEAVPEDLTANWIELDGTKYYLQQFHFHVSSEHTLDGSGEDAELHLVNKADNGDLAVLGVLLQVGDANAALAELLSAVPVAPTTESTEVSLTQAIDPAALVPADSEIARYDGSLTTPPCTEGVHWNVYLTPVTVSNAQLAALSAAYDDNHRPTQQLNGREVDEVRD